jgi:catechol 2,3-dioxygenase-like lactoylglutathione lyase family enzyme
MQLTHTALVVQDQQKALDFYTNVLGFEKKADIANRGFRWLTVAPKGSAIEIVLMQGTPMHQRGVAGDRWILATDDCRRDFHALKAKGVKFEEEKPQEGYFGVNATFSDVDGNRFMLRQAPPDQPQRGRVVDGAIVTE